MKLRKHKNNRTFRISFRQCLPVVKETHVRLNGKHENILSGGTFGNVRTVTAVGSDEGSVLRAFLFGRDASNIRTTVFEGRTV